jgi:hypothetical protein
MIDAEIAKYFGYQEKDAIVNLIKSAQYIFSHSKDEPLLDEILMLSDISMDAPMFLKHLEEQLREYANKADSTSYYPKVQKSPSPLQESVVTWLYYALYWAYKLDVKEKTFSYPHSLSRIVLLFHKHYLHYKSEEKRQLGTKEDYQGKDFFENIAQGLTRALEYMAVMAREEDAHLNSVYFSKHIKDDLALHFLKLASSDMLEKNYFYIMNQKNKDDNYLLYENIAEEIRLKVKLSRILRSGDDAKTLRNQKIVGYFVKDLLQYQKLKAVVFKGEKGGGKGGGKKNNGIQYTQREDFDDVLYVPNSKSLEILSHEEEQEVLQKEKKKYRAIPYKDEESEEGSGYIQNSDKQRNINRAFSANVTKKSLKLTVDYDIPEKRHLKAFIQSLSIPKIDATFEYEPLFFTIFLLSCVTGVEYTRIINALWGKDKLLTIDLNERFVTIELDETLFAKGKRNPLFVKSRKSISYTLPPLLIMLIKKIKIILDTNINKVSDTEKCEILLSKQVEKWYENYVKKRVEAFDKKIVIKPKQMWRVVEAYRKETLKEEMSTLFCVGKYQIVDRSKMAYASVHHKGQVHAEFIVSLYSDLGLADVLSSALGLDASLYTPKRQIDRQSIYAGSSVAIKVEESKKFFLEMHELIVREDNDILHFNLTAIYMKYALSLLLGTRTTRYSTPLDNISFSLHILSISEKASTLLSGIRVIPLCKRAEQLIHSYQYRCHTMNVPKGDIYMIEKDHGILYQKDLALTILNDVNASAWLHNFVSIVPTNTGRHIITKEARENNFNGYYLDALLGHYSSGEEQLGIFSTMDMSEYINKCRKLTQDIADKYGVLAL